MKSYKILNYNSNKPIFISCEHASKRIPEKYSTLGLKRKKLMKFPDYYDVGAKELAVDIANEFKARCIIPNYSRMVINLNKPLSFPKVINDVCFGMRIYGNENLSKKDKEERIKKYYLPYHGRIQKDVNELKKIHDKLHYICVHTFYHDVNGLKRRPDIGLMYKHKKDEAFCKKLKKLLTEKSNFEVKFNKPFSAKEGAAYSMNKYAGGKEFTCVEFEINDKHLLNKKSIKRMSKLLISVLKEAMKK